MLGAVAEKMPVLSPGPSSSRRNGWPVFTVRAQERVHELDQCELMVICDGVLCLGLRQLAQYSVVQIVFLDVIKQQFVQPFESDGFTVGTVCGAVEASPIAYGWSARHCWSWQEVGKLRDADVAMAEARSERSQTLSQGFCQ